VTAIVNLGQQKIQLPLLLDDRTHVNQINLIGVFDLRPAHKLLFPQVVGNLDTGFCGSRRRVTASGHPVGDP
jgi:hypothetical protein